METLMEAVRAAVRDLETTDPVGRIDLITGSGRRVPIRRPIAQPEPGPGPRHSADYRSCNWYGKQFRFTPTQARVIEVLWNALRNGTPEMGQTAILDAAGSSASRLDHVFRDRIGGAHPAWGTMIARVGRATYRMGPA